MYITVKCPKAVLKPARAVNNGHAHPADRREAPRNTFQGTQTRTGWAHPRGREMGPDKPQRHDVLVRTPVKHGCGSPCFRIQCLNYCSLEMHPDYQGGSTCRDQIDLYNHGVRFVSLGRALRGRGPVYYAYTSRGHPAGFQTNGNSPAAMTCLSWLLARGRVSMTP